MTARQWRTMLDDPAAALVLAALAFAGWVAWTLLEAPEATECGSKCFRHQSRPRVHVPCSRCRDDHPLS